MALAVNQQKKRVEAVPRGLLILGAVNYNSQPVRMLPIASGRERSALARPPIAVSFQQSTAVRLSPVSGVHLAIAVRLLRHSHQRLIHAPTTHSLIVLWSLVAPGTE